MAKNLFVIYCYISIFVAVFVLNSCNSQKQIESSKVFRYNEYRNVTSLDLSLIHISEPTRPY